MRSYRYKLIYILFLLFTSIICFGQTQTRTFSSIPDSTTKKIAERLEQIATLKKAKISCRIESSSGSVFDYGYDGRTQKTFTPGNQLIEIGSATKMFTATAVLQLVEKGKFQLTDKLVNVWPEIRSYASLCNRNATLDSIEIHHLLSHTSGFPDYFPSPDSVAMIMYGDSAISFTPGSLLRLAIRLKHTQKEVAIGQFRYSNVNYIILGLLVEKFSGLKYHQYIQNNILNKAGMTSTFFLSSPKLGGRPPGHFHGELVYMPASMAWSAGEIVSTGPDMCRFISRWNSGAFFSKPSTMANLKSIYYTDMVPGISYGLGIIKLVNKSFGHAGQTFGFENYTGISTNGNRFVISIDDASVEVWSLAVYFSELL
ncbi:MAG: serine hydrolase domain-containing protein [Chitinophagaceae bacterium]